MAASIRPLHDRVLIKRIYEQEQTGQGAGMPMPVGEWTTERRHF